MNKKIVFCGVLLLCFQFCIAQSEEKTPGEKKVNHYVGVQANALMRQLISLSNNSGENTNPYLFTYGMRSVKSGWGVEVGLGYTLNLIKNTDTHANESSNINDLFSRIGFGRHVAVGKWFDAGYFFDFNSSLQDDRTTNETTSTFGNSVQTNKNKTTTTAVSIGAGPRLCLAFHITDRVSIGTETSYYLAVKQEKDITTVTSTTVNNTTGTSFTNTTDTSPKILAAKVNFSSPVALFLTLKF